MSLFPHTRSVLDSMRTRLEIPSFALYIDTLLVHFSHLVPSLSPRVASVIVALVCDALMAFVFALPIYVIYLFESTIHIDMPYWLGSILGALSLYAYLRVPKSRRFGFGFFVVAFLQQLFEFDKNSQKFSTVSNKFFHAVFHLPASFSKPFLVKIR